MIPAAQSTTGLMYPGGKQARAAWSLKLNLDHERENVSCAKSTSAWPGLLCEDAPWWRQIWEGKASTRDRMVLTLMSSKSSCLCFLIVSISASSAPLKPVDSERIKIPLWKLYWGQHIMEKAAPTSRHLPSPRVMPQELISVFQHLHSLLLQPLHLTFALQMVLSPGCAAQTISPLLAARSSAQPSQLTLQTPTAHSANSAHPEHGEELSLNALWWLVMSVIFRYWKSMT